MFSFCTPGSEIYDVTCELDLLTLQGRIDYMNLFYELSYQIEVMFMSQGLVFYEKDTELGPQIYSKMVIFDPFSVKKTSSILSY